MFGANSEVKQNPFPYRATLHRLSEKIVIKNNPDHPEVKVEIRLLVRYLGSFA